MSAELPVLADEPAIACAQTVVGALIAGGVRDAVLAPGSRSAPMAYVLHTADRAGLLRLHVRIDERGAGFLALGLAKASGRPVPVLTTSGTAAANLHPAVLEASAAGVPLVAVTADRPGALRHAGANQTTDQIHLFGAQVRGFAALEDTWSAPGGWRAEVGRLLALAAGLRTRRPGPVHLNVALSDPLAPHGAAAPVVLGPTAVAAAQAADPIRLAAGARTVVVAGDASPTTGQAVVELCAQAHLPLLAEPSSNARRGPAALATYRILLASPLATEIERVVVVGRPTLSRPVNALLARRDVELIVVSERGDWPDPGLRQPFVVDAVTLEPDESDWLARWQAADHRTAARLTDLLDHSDVLTGPAVARAVVDGIAPGSPLVLGSSNPIRDADLAPVRDDLGEVYANRGLAGIDGTLSTATGIALALGRPTHALVGDLTFLHDLTGLVIGPDEPRPDLRIVVANDDGGSIFATLEHGRPALEESHERIFGTAHHADLVEIAGGLGITAARAGSLEELEEALRVPPSGIEVLEATIDRSGRLAMDQAITALAATL